MTSDGALRRPLVGRKTITSLVRPNERHGRFSRGRESVWLTEDAAPWLSRGPHPPPRRGSPGTMAGAIVAR